MVNAWTTLDKVWPHVILAGYSYFALVANGWYLVKVFCAAASISSECEHLLTRVHELHGLLAAHSPELQPECERFHGHIKRAGLSFQAMNLSITYKLGGIAIYTLSTAMGLTLASAASTTFDAAIHGASNNT